MRPPGKLLAAGRDADIFEYGDGTVLRRSREGRSQEREASILEYLRANDYPAPEAIELSDDGLELVLQRIDGPTMVQAIGRRPWTLRPLARSLAQLHERLHMLDAPKFLAPAPVGSGIRMLHMDLHPLNVMISPTGPIVIDWSGARVGDPFVDVAAAWVLMAVGEIPSGPLGALQHLGRHELVRTFLRQFDRAQLTARLRDVVTWKARDPHMSDREVALMWALVADAESRR
jgi:aminoglycoside phosphotransferase (APT) family kinase protein